MKLHTWTKLLGCLTLAFALASCCHPTKKGDGDASIDDAITDVEAVDQSDMGGVGETARLDIKDGVEYGQWSAIHFDYDSATIREDDRATLEEIAKWAKENPNEKIMVAGHCDERGTLEYNRALGQRRANAARTYLINLGVDTSRIGTISYGEEQPVDPGHTDEAWAKNRRDEFGVVK